MLFREMNLELRKADGNAVPVVVSTETPVPRGQYFEVLGHAPNEVDLSRAPLPLIESHNSSRVNIGIIDELRAVDGKLRGIARFGESARAQELLTDIKGGIVRSLSIGYLTPNDGKRVGERDGVPVLRFSGWQPYETSIVAVPADTEAGFYRNHSEEHIMDKDSNNDGAGDNNRASVETQRERTRVLNINAVATQWRDKIGNMDELTTKALNDGWPIDKFRAAVMDAMEGSQPIRMAETGQADMRGNTRSGTLGLSGRDIQRFSLMRAIEGLADPKIALKGASFEMSVMQAEAQRAGRNHTEGNRGTIPLEVIAAGAGKRTMSVGTNNAGGFLVENTIEGFVDVLRPLSVVAQMGASVMAGLQGNLLIPRQTGTATVQWVAENGAASASQLALDQISLTPHTITGFTDLTRRLRLQSSPAAEQLVRQDLMTTLALGIDSAAINGTGASNQPTGLLYISGLGAEIGGTNGAAPTWDNIVDMETIVGTANATLGNLGYLTNPKVRGKLKRTQKFSGANADSIWDSENVMQNGAGSMNGYRAFASTQVPSNLTKGTSSGVCSAIIFGNWSDLIIGQWGSIDLLVDPYTFSNTGALRVVVIADVDVNVKHAASFVAMVDALTT